MAVSSLAKRPIGWLIIAAIAAFVTSVAYKALRAPFAVEDFPDSLYVKVERIPAIFDVHMISGGLALLLVPLAIALSGRPRWHRPLARLAALDIAVAGVTAFPVALVVINTATPGLDPYKLCEAIKTHAGGGLRVIFLVGRFFSYMPELARKSGCEGFVSKPLLQRQLDSLLRRYLPSASATEA